jgi:manganese-dependent ADP-ribose/CDP-alcohol diphosphatase
MFTKNSVQAQVKIGIFADCQYCDYETSGNRYYKNSLWKLTNCISEFNKSDEIDFVVGMGDLIDRDFVSFTEVKSILEDSRNEVFHVIGNHDFSVESEFLEKVPEQLNLSETYYTFNKKGWRFIFLNGNEITFQSSNPEIIKQAENMIKQLSFENKPNNRKWNGGMSEAQILWMEQQLREAQENEQKVALFCHYPILPLEAHTLWNSEEVLAVIEKYNCVKLWMNGHNHSGNYISNNGIHYITFTGMVDTETENAFSIVSISENQVKIEGFGREKNRVLSIK